MIDLGILTLTLWVLSGIITTIAGHLLYEPPRPAAAPQALPTQKQASKTRGYYDVIMQRDLLKVARSGPKSDRAPVEEDIVRPLAEMGLTLKGTITGSKEIARAIIEEKRQQEIYQVGDRIKGAELLAIYRNKVIMDVGGQEQMLVVEEAKGSTPSAARPRAAAPGAPTLSGPEPGDLSGLSNIMQNLDEYIGKARVVPYFKGGEAYGFRVSNVERESMIYDLGVRSGDVIRAVNGQPIRTPEDAFKLYQEMQNETAVEVELERRGSSINLTVPLQ